MEFIEDDGGDAVEGGVFLEDALKDAIGEVEDFCFLGVFGVEADGVADFVAEGGVAVLGDEAGEEPCGDAAGLDDENAVWDFWEISDEGGDFGGFSGAGGGGEEDALVLGGGGAEVGGDFVDGEGHGGEMMVGVGDLMKKNFDRGWHGYSRIRVKKLESRSVTF